MLTVFSRPKLVVSLCPTRERHFDVFSDCVADVPDLVVDELVL